MTANRKASEASTLSNVSGEQKPLNTYDGIRQFASTLTERSRELDQKEREYLIVPGQAAEILQSMIENFVYTVVRLEIRRKEYEQSNPHG